jgi:hypothetical protein
MSDIPSWLPSALTGGLAGAAFTQLLNWWKSAADAKHSRAAQLKALQQELLLALSIIEYNHDQVLNEGKPYKGLTTVSTANAERVLFGGMPSLPIQSDTVEGLRDYLKQVTYLNSLVVEQRQLIPNSVSNADVQKRLSDYFALIKAICTDAPVFDEKSHEPALRVKARSIVEALQRVNV